MTAENALVYSPWRTATAIRTYLAGVLWIGGAVAVLVTHDPDVAGWLRIRSDFAGVILTIGAFVGGWNFFPKALRGIRRFRLDMNFLMTIAIIGALLIGEPIEAAAIAALFSLAELLEAAAVVRGRRAVHELLRLTPPEAKVVGTSGAEESVPTEQLRVGHVVRVRPGEPIPIDGKVRDGESGVDESTVTGESVPVTKTPGDPVYAGTTVVEGYLEIEATTDAGDTTLDRIVKLVRQAQARRAPIEHFVERFSIYYTPAVTALAAATIILPPLLGFGTGLEWFTRGLTLLVIACPCALVIATPVTMVSGLTSAARHGVVIKGGEFLEALGGTCAMAFDKTGSLTQGQLRVTGVHTYDGFSVNKMLALAVAVEERSEHPIARAIVDHGQTVRDPNLSVSDFEARTGRGVVAKVNGQTIKAGTPELFSSHIALPEQLAAEREGKTVVLVGDGDAVFGFIALADVLRPNAPSVLARLRRMGVHEQVMLTGDHDAVAQAIAKQVGIRTVRSRLLPEEKVAAVEQLRSQHDVVAMLGDGVNDAPALTAASVGIAMGAIGSPATIETADVALMADDLAMLPYAVRVARLARRLVRFNIVLALSLKGLLAIGAVTGVVSLLVAVLVGDLGASIVVTLNAMRIAHVKPSAI